MIGERHFSGSGGDLISEAGVPVRDGERCITWLANAAKHEASGFEICAWQAPPRCAGCAHFPESRLITPEWGETLNTWASRKGQEWGLCCSTFEGCDTAAKFHAACDGRAPTLTVAHNAGGTWTFNGKAFTNPGDFTFGGFVRKPSSPNLLPAIGAPETERRDAFL